MWLERRTRICYVLAQLHLIGKIKDYDEDDPSFKVNVDDMLEAILYKDNTTKYSTTIEDKTIVYYEFRSIDEKEYVVTTLDGKVIEINDPHKVIDSKYKSIIRGER